MNADFARRDRPHFNAMADQLGLAGAANSHLKMQGRQEDGPAEQH
jgi:hypothetical protein